MDNNEVAHLWANKSRSSARAGHFYFEGDTIYSYGSHFPVARHHKGVVLFTSKRYSVTTARHIGITRSACSHLQTFTVSVPLRDPCGDDVKDYAKQIESEAMAAARARNATAALESLQRTVGEANLFCQTFGFKTRFEMPANLDELKAKAKASAERERKAKALRVKKEEAAAQEAIDKWLAGEQVSIPGHIGKVYLRARLYQYDEGRDPEQTMETSKGARVPLGEAHKAYRFAICKRDKGWSCNGETFAVGSYHLDAVNAQGIVAGCHRITWDEVERFATLQGW